MQTPMQFPNGNLIMIPSDMFFFFETQSLANASPIFISSIGIINACEEDIEISDLYVRQLKLIEKKHKTFFEEFRVNV
jgi:hypothetical protein